MYAYRIKESSDGALQGMLAADTSQELISAVIQISSAVNLTKSLLPLLEKRIDCLRWRLVLQDILYRSKLPRGKHFRCVHSCTGPLRLHETSERAVPS